MVQGTKTQKLRGKQKILQKEDWIVVPGTHEPIIDKKTWQQTQQLLTKNIRSTTDTKKSEGGASALFSGFLFCSDCQKPMVRTSWRHADGRREYSFTCGTCKRHGRAYCSPHTIPARIVTYAILQDLGHILSHSGDISHLVQQQEMRMLNRTASVSSSHRVSAEKEYRCARQMFLSSYEDYKTGLLSREEFLSCRDLYREKKRLYTDKMRTLAHGASVLQERLRSSSAPALSARRGMDFLDRALLSALISHITVYEGYRIHIHYTFSPTAAPSFPSQYTIKN